MGGRHSAAGDPELRAQQPQSSQPAASQGQPAVDYSGGAAARANPPAARRPARFGASMVWIKDQPNP